MNELSFRHSEQRRPQATLSDTPSLSRTAGLEWKTFLDKMLQVKRSAGDFPHRKPTNQYLSELGGVSEWLVVSSTGSVSGVGAGLFLTNGNSLFAMASLKRARRQSIMLSQGIA